ncbi:hypothetical protein B0H16DRAFT_1735524 [Mycena metata]|uniref:Uncharacterized protein n=1 Tax=Mycena metata TaxID=1033252 RepID=A0AAD7MPX7_9AGAR|nr:hypothetical protein B0H16DRAFT_1735524 [Mycena metata]
MPVQVQIDRNYASLNAGHRLGFNVVQVIKSLQKVVTMRVRAQIDRDYGLTPGPSTFSASFNVVQRLQEGVIMRFVNIFDSTQRWLLKAHGPLLRWFIVMFDQHSFNPTSYSTSTSTHLHLKTQPILVWFDSRNPTWGISGMRSVPEFTWDFRESMLSLSLDNSRPSFLRLEFSTLTKSIFALRVPVFASKAFPSTTRIQVACACVHLIQPPVQLTASS